LPLPISTKAFLELDYGIIHPRGITQCDWVRNGLDSWGNPTYKRDEVGFLMANFLHILTNGNDSFVFPHYYKMWVQFTSPRSSDQ